MTPDERDECEHTHTGFEGNIWFSGGELNDNMVEVCTDCGKVLDAIETESEEFDV